MRLHDLITLDMCEQHRSLHLGKFHSCRDAVLHAASLNGADSTGSVEWHAHVSVIGVERDAVAVDDNGDHVLVAAGTYLIYEYSSGQVTVEHYADESDAERHFKTIDEEYDAWLSVEDDDWAGE